jgi:1-acyl-sn-glycerol-3-phosphate acyltransferase
MPNLRAVVMLFWTLVWTLVGIITVVVDPTGRLFMYLARVGWARQVLWLGGVRPEVRAAAGFSRAGIYVVVSNHASQLDIPVLFLGLGLPIRFLAKRSLFFIPLFGWSLWLARFVPVDRGRSRKARRSIDRAARRIRKGPSLAVFPEGTRSPDGQVREFKSGAFVLAIRSGVPILPVAVRGTFEVVPKTRIAVRPGPVELVIGTPIPTAGLGLEAKDALRRRVREVVVRMHESGQPV